MARGGRWHSEQVSRLQVNSSFDFPTLALCTVPMPKRGGQPALHPDAVGDSYAALATWADIVVIGAEGGRDASLAPGVTLGDLVQAPELPVILVVE